MALTHSTAIRVRLKIMIQSDLDPKLTDDEVTALLDGWALAPSNQVAEVTAYDLNGAAAEGWRWKAGKATAMTDFKKDGGEYALSQVLANCSMQEAKYERLRQTANISVGTAV